MHDDPVSDAPTIQELRAWRDLLVGEHSDLTTDQEASENLYFQRFSQLGLGDSRQVKTGSAPSDADSAVDTLVPVDIQVRVTPARNRDKYKKQAELLTRFGQALIKAWRKKKDPIRRVVNDMTLRNLGVIRVLFDDLAWEKVPAESSSEAEDADGLSPRLLWETKYRRKCPIVFERRDPRYVSFRDDEDGNILVLVEHYPTTVLEARLTFSEYPGALKELRSREPRDTVWVSDVWYGPHRCVMVENMPIYGEESDADDDGIVLHGYDEIPYRYAAFRELPFDGMADRFRGLFSNTLELYPMESQVLGMQVEMLKWNAWRTYKGWTVDGRKLDIQPGKYVEIDQRKGEWLEMMGGEPVPPEVLQTVAVVGSYIERNSAPQGPGTAEGTRSGQQIWAIQAIRQMKLEAARQALLEMMEGALCLAAMIVEKKIPDGLTLPVPGRDREGNARGEVTIKPKDIDGYWNGWDISFGKRLDPAMLEQAKAISALVANNFIPYLVGVELSGLAETPQQWEDDLFLQATDRLPFLIELGAYERLIGEYSEDSWQAQVYKQHLQQSMMQAEMGGSPTGAPGMPTSGGGLEPPSAVGPMVEPSVTPNNDSRTVGRTPGSRTPGGGAPPPGPGGMGV